MLGTQVYECNLPLLVCVFVTARRINSIGIIGVKRQINGIFEQFGESIASTLARKKLIKANARIYDIRKK